MKLHIFFGGKWKNDTVSLICIFHISSIKLFLGDLSCLFHREGRIDVMWEFSTCEINFTLELRKFSEGGKLFMDDVNSAINIVVSCGGWRGSWVMKSIQWCCFVKIRVQTICIKGLHSLAWDDAILWDYRQYLREAVQLYSPAPAIMLGTFPCRPSRGSSFPDDYCAVPMNAKLHVYSCENLPHISHHFFFS